VHFALLADAEPINYKAALNEKMWKNAMIEEFNSINRNNTWELSEFPANKKAIDVKWIFQIETEAK